MPWSPTETRYSAAFIPPVTLMPMVNGLRSASGLIVYCQITNMNGTSRSAASPEMPCALPVPCSMSQVCTP